MYALRLSLPALLLTVVLGASAVYAARDDDIQPAAHRAAGLEIVVMEVKGCLYCPIFRRDVLPGYLASPRGRSVPIRFQDLNDKGVNDLHLKSQVDIVPTVVVLSGGSEIGRIPGYVGPENFQRMLTSLLIGRE